MGMVWVVMDTVVADRDPTTLPQEYPMSPSGTDLKSISKVSILKVVKFKLF